MERWERVTLLYLSAERCRISELRLWLADHPQLLPVNFLEIGDRESAGLEAERYDCSVTIFLDRDTHSPSIEPSEIEQHLDSGDRVVIREGSVQRQAT